VGRITPYSLIKLISPFIVLLAWEYTVRSGAVNALFLPPPSVIFLTAIEAFKSEGLIHHLMISGIRLPLGFCIGVGSALLCAMGMALSNRVRWFLSPFITIIYPIPKVALYPLLIIWLGASEMSKVLLVATGSFFPVVINTTNALREVSPVLIRAARNLGANKRQIFIRVALPSALPAVYAGTLIGAGLSLIMLVYAEMTASQAGIGYYTYISASLFKTENAFAGVVIISIIGFIWYRIILWTEKRHCPWQREVRGQ